MIAPNIDVIIAKKKVSFVGLPIFEDVKYFEKAKMNCTANIQKKSVSKF